MTRRLLFVIFVLVFGVTLQITNIQCQVSTEIQSPNKSNSSDETGNMSGILATVVEGLNGLSNLVNTTADSLVDMVAVPQDTIMGILNQVIDSLVSTILSVIDGILGKDNYITNTTKQIESCIKTSSIDLLYNIESSLANCVIEPVTKAAQNLGKILEDLGAVIDFLLNLVSHILSLDIISIHNTTISDGTTLIKNVTGDLLEVPSILISVTAGLPTCLTKSLTITPVELLTKMVYNIIDCYT